MINQLEPEPKKVIEKQITTSSLKNVNIGRIDLDYLSGKKSKKECIRDTIKTLAPEQI